MSSGKLAARLRLSLRIPLRPHATAAMDGSMVSFVAPRRFVPAEPLAPYTPLRCHDTSPILSYHFDDFCTSKIHSAGIFLEVQR